MIRMQHLCTSAALRNEQLCALLLEKGANVNVLDNGYRTPLHKCQSRSGGTSVAKIILDKKPDLIDSVDCFGKTALYMACQAGNLESKYLS